MASSCTPENDNGLTGTEQNAGIHEAVQSESVEDLLPVTSTSVTATKTEESEAHPTSIPVNVVGTYDWSPTGWHRDYIWMGVLDVDTSTGCVFMDVTYRNGYDVNFGSGILRAFLRFSSQAVMDISGDTVNFIASETLSDGDVVAVAGTPGWREDWRRPDDDEVAFSSTWDGDPQCWANVPFWVSWIGPASVTMPQPDPEPAPVAGLLPTDFRLMSHMQEDYGYLQIEGRCLYLRPLQSYRQLQSEESQEIRFVRDGLTTGDTLHDALQRSFLRLPQPKIEFRSDSQQLWFRGRGPMTNGDLVIIGGDNATGRYKGVDNYIDGCHAPWVVAPSSIELCATDEYCQPPDSMLSEMPMAVKPPQISSSTKPTTMTEDFYVEQYGVTLEQTRKRLARIPQLQALLDEILDIELHRLAGLAIDHYGKFGAWVWLTGNDTPDERTTEIAATNPDLEIRLGADHTYFELLDAARMISNITGIDAMTHSPGGLDWLIHFIDVDMRSNNIEIGIDPGHETRSARIPVDPDRPKASDQEIQTAIKTVEEALKNRVPVAYNVTDGRKAAQLAKRRPENNTYSLDQAYYQHQLQKHRNQTQNNE